MLIRRADSIRRRDSVQSWLFGVARRVAVQVKIDAARRRRIEQKAAALRVVSDHAETDELRLILTEELARLPEKYRAPLLLCDMDGLTYDAAARRLGCPAGTVGVRLKRARERLRGRLTRRGIGLSPAVLAAWAGAEKANAAMPAQLVAAVVEAASRSDTAGAASIAARVADRTLRARFSFRAAITAGLIVAAGVGLGFALARGLPGESPPARTPAPASLSLKRLPIRRRGRSWSTSASSTTRPRSRWKA